MERSHSDLLSHRWWLLEAIVGKVLAFAVATARPRSPFVVRVHGICSTRFAAMIASDAKSSPPDATGKSKAGKKKGATPAAGAGESAAGAAPAASRDSKSPVLVCVLFCVRSDFVFVTHFGLFQGWGAVSGVLSELGVFEHPILAV